MDDPINVFAGEIKRNIEFLNHLVTRNNLIIGTVGMLGVLLLVIFVH